MTPVLLIAQIFLGLMLGAISWWFWNNNGPQQGTRRRTVLSKPYVSWRFQGWTRRKALFPGRPRSTAA